MVRYEVISKLNGKFKTLIALGFIPVHINDWKRIYEHYLIERKSHKKMQSYCNTAERFRVNEMTVRRIVDWMETS